MNGTGAVTNAGGSSAGGSTTGMGGSIGGGGSTTDAGLFRDCGGLPPPEPKPLPEPLIPNPDPTATLKEIFVSGPPSMFSTGSANVSITVHLRDQGVYSDGTVRNIDNIFADIDYHTLVTWSSSDPTIASVMSGDTRTAGSMHGYREGTVTITVSVQGISKSVCFVVTPPVVASLTISGPTSSTTNPNGPIVAKPGDAVPLTCTKTMTDGTTGDVTSLVTWASSVSSVATVSSTGSTSALSGGTTLITATLPASVQTADQNAGTDTATLDVIGNTGLQQGADCTTGTCAAGLSCCTIGRFGPPSCNPTLSPMAPCPPPPPLTP
jgi:trimeric autotransporter adhesin